MTLERHVYRQRSDPSGALRALVATSAPWSPRQVADAVVDIESGRVRYVVDWGGGPLAVVVVRDEGDPRLDVLGPDGAAGGLSSLPPA